jgi:hypothetical protein
MGDRCVMFIIPLITEAEKVSETLGSCPELTRLVAREDFVSLVTVKASSLYEQNTV